MSTSTALGRLHRYWSKRNLTLFEHLSSDQSIGSIDRRNTLVFIGGLSDSFLSVPYVPLLASYINQCPDWSLMEIQLSSSGLGWGTVDLNSDAEEIAKAVEYLKNRQDTANADQNVKIVLMGHSTGSQDVLHYLYHHPKQQRPAVDGAILQAAVSDREALTMMREQDPSMQNAYEECLRISSTPAPNTPDSLAHTVPLHLTSTLGWSRAHVSIARFLSLTSPTSPTHPSLDDLFSSDLSDETLQTTFGAVGQQPHRLLNPTTTNPPRKPSILILLSEHDEYTPPSIDKATLIERWAAALATGDVGIAPGSGVLAGASHAVREGKAQLELVQRVLGYLGRIDGRGVPGTVSSGLVEEMERVGKRSGSGR
jgi:pimeloyl-ACP methyl ester carboxylesterase